MRVMELTVVVLLAGVSLTFAAGKGASLVGAGPVMVNPALVDTNGVVNAPVVVDTNVLALLAAEEKVLQEKGKDITRQIVVRQKPLRDARERILSEDKELQAMVSAIAAKQKELDARLAAKHPELAAKTTECNELIRQYSEVNGKLRELRRKMDEMEEAIRKQTRANKGKN